MLKPPSAILPHKFFFLLNPEIFLIIHWYFYWERFPSFRGSGEEFGSEIPGVALRENSSRKQTHLWDEATNYGRDKIIHTYGGMVKVTE